MEDMEDIPQDSNSLPEQSILTASTTCTDEIHDIDTDNQTIFNLRREPHRNQLPTKPLQPNSPTTSNNSSLLMITVLLLGVTAAVLLAMWVTTRDKECSNEIVKQQGIIELLNYKLKHRTKEGTEQKTEECLKASECEEELKKLTQINNTMWVKYARMEAILEARTQKLYEIEKELAKTKAECDWKEKEKLNEIIKKLETLLKIMVKAETTHETSTNNQM